MRDAIKKAVKLVGTQQKLADALGIHQSAVNQWVTGVRPVPARQCMKIERLCNGEVTAAELLPEVFLVETPKQKRSRKRA